MPREVTEYLPELIARIPNRLVGAEEVLWRSPGAEPDDDRETAERDECAVEEAEPAEDLARGTCLEKREDHRREQDRGDERGGLDTGGKGESSKTDE